MRKPINIVARPLASRAFGDGSPSFELKEGVDPIITPADCASIPEIERVMVEMAQVAARENEAFVITWTKQDPEAIRGSTLHNGLLFVNQHLVLCGDGADVPVLFPIMGQAMQTDWGKHLKPHGIPVAESEYRFVDRTEEKEAA